MEENIKDDAKEEVSHFEVKGRPNIGLSSEQGNTGVNLATLIKQKAEELKEKLEKLSIPRLKDEHMIKIIDLMPTNTEVLKVLLQAYTVTVTQENLKKIVGVVQEYASEK